MINLTVKRRLTNIACCEPIVEFFIGSKGLVHDMEPMMYFSDIESLVKFEIKAFFLMLAILDNSVLQLVSLNLRSVTSGACEEWIEIYRGTAKDDVIEVEGK